MGRAASDGARSVARVHERIRWRRSDFTHQESRRLVNQFDLIAVEDLSVRNMVRNQCPRPEHPRRSVDPVCMALLRYKAAWASQRIHRYRPRVYVADLLRLWLA